MFQRKKKFKKIFGFLSFNLHLNKKGIFWGKKKKNAKFLYQIEILEKKKIYSRNFMEFQEETSLLGNYLST